MNSTKILLCIAFGLMVNTANAASDDQIQGIFSCKSLYQVELGLNEKGTRYINSDEDKDTFFIKYMFDNRLLRPQVSITSPLQLNIHSDIRNFYFYANAETLELRNPNHDAMSVSNKFGELSFLLSNYTLSVEGLTLGTEDEGIWQAAVTSDSSYGSNVSGKTTIAECVTDRSIYLEFKKAVMQHASEPKH